MRTRGEKTLLAALKQARRQGKDVIVGVRAMSAGMGPTPSDEARGCLWTGVVEADDLIGMIDAPGAAMSKQGIADALETNGTALVNADEYVIKEL
jgi:hypothetical protein